MHKRSGPPLFRSLRQFDAGPLAKHSASRTGGTIANPVSTAGQPLSAEFPGNPALDGTFLIIGGMRYKEGNFREEGHGSRTIGQRPGSSRSRN